MKPALFGFLYIVSFVLMPDYGFAHSGGLNGSGCHGGSRLYHCHRSALEMVPSSQGGYRLRCDLGSRSQDCLGGSYSGRSSSGASSFGRGDSDGGSSYILNPGRPSAPQRDTWRPSQTWGSGGGNNPQTVAPYVSMPASRQVRTPRRHRSAYEQCLRGSSRVQLINVTKEQFCECFVVQKEEIAIFGAMKVCSGQ